METKVESKIGKIANSSDKVYNFLSDFRNFSRMIPPDKVKNWQADENSCRFTVDMIGEIGLKVIEKQPNSLIKITGAEGSKFNFNFWIQLKESSPSDSRIKLTIKADLNPMMTMMAKKPLQNFVDTLVDQLEKIPF
jgi:carbon monoxide dehydrogenase subunit G